MSEPLMPDLVERATWVVERLAGDVAAIHARPQTAETAPRLAFLKAWIREMREWRDELATGQPTETPGEMLVALRGVAQRGKYSWAHWKHRSNAPPEALGNRTTWRVIFTIADAFGLDPYGGEEQVLDLRPLDRIGRCRGVKADGSPCRAAERGRTGYCLKHQAQAYTGAGDQAQAADQVQAAESAAGGRDHQAGDAAAIDRQAPAAADPLDGQVDAWLQEWATAHEAGRL